MAKSSLRNWHNGHKSFHFWIATFFGSGWVRPAPGTWGSLAAMLAGVALIESEISIKAYCTLIVIITILGIWSINAIERMTNIHDAGEIVIDEVAGMWITLLPVYMFSGSYTLYIIAFVLFRIFDIIKPWPISYLDDHISGGFGVMIDDIVAGVFASGVIILIGLYTSVFV